ncbi:hypothetical protein [Cupriavidus nantongensis]|uniref:hypothetical protein n=1 Tax=Cupriavidus nantongensis TaxID=1796606 RepID=UPI00123768DC|nr:hypothetical protein [Cupriavidus nantongensis]
MLTLLDFSERFEEIAARYNHVYYSRHPFVKSGDEEILSFISRFRNVSVVDVPSYSLLALDEIKLVFAISSSVVEEARYFDKDIEYLFKPAVPLGTDCGRFVSVYQDFVMPHFWAEILSPDFHVNVSAPLRYLDGKDKIRGYAVILLGISEH